MNLHSIINPGDFGGFAAAGVPESPSSQAVQYQAGVDASRSAQRHTNVRVASPATCGSKRSRPHGLSEPRTKRRATAASKSSSEWSTTPPEQSQSASASALTLKDSRLERERHRPPPSGKRRSPPAARPPSAASSRSEQSAKDARMRAQAVADLYSVARGHQVSIMDVVLDAQPAVPGGNEDLLDALEECQRIAMHGPSDEDAVLEMLSARWYGVRQARKWQGTVTPPVDCSPSRIYRVSAERSTASWGESLDSDDAASPLDACCTALQSIVGGDCNQIP